MVNQIKIGKFIAAKRKEKSITQAEVAGERAFPSRCVNNAESVQNPGHQYHGIAHGRSDNGRGL